MSNLSNETLLKRASHAGRNLFVLACLVTLAAIALTLLAFSINGGPPIIAGAAALFTLLAAAYWLLTVAARRGNPSAVSIVIMIAVVQMVLNLVVYGIAAARSESEFKPNVGGLVIPILIMIALSRSRNVLLELRKRGMWEQVFATAKPSIHLCVIGGVLMVTAVVGLNAGSIYVEQKAAAALDQEYRRAEAFVRLVEDELEQENIISIPALSDPNRDASIKATLIQIAVLEQRLAAIQRDARDDHTFESVLTTYGAGLRQQKNALLSLQEENPDMERAVKLFQLADKLKAEATQEYNRRYAAKNGP